MNIRRCLPLLAGLVSAAIAPLQAASKATSDLTSPQKRQQAVELAEGLTRPPVPAPVPAGLVTPFNPPNFNQPDPEAQKASAAARAASDGGGPVQPAGPSGDRETLEVIAARIQPTGMLEFGGKPLLTFARGKQVRVGQSFVVPYNGQDYELELVAVDRTTFTLRLRGEEITRPIKPTK